MNIDVRPDYQVYLRVLSALLIVHAIVRSRMQVLPALGLRQWAAPVLFVLPAYAIAIGVDVSDSLPTVAWSAGVGVVLALVNFVDTLLRKPRWDEEAVTSLYAAVNCTLAGLVGMATAVPWYAAVAATLLVRTPAQQMHPYVELVPNLYAPAFRVTLLQHGEQHRVTVTKKQDTYVEAQFVGSSESAGAATVTSALAALARMHSKGGTWTIYQAGAPVPPTLTFEAVQKLASTAFEARPNNPGTLVF